MTLRQAARITRELLADNHDASNTMHHVLSPQRTEALQRLLEHAGMSITHGHRIPHGARLSPLRGPKP
jgi:hypothetical protein